MILPCRRATIFGAKARIVLAVPFRLLSITSSPVAVLHLQQRLPALDGGVGHDDVDLAVIALDRARDPAQGGDVADVGLDGLGAAAIALDVAHRLGQLVAAWRGWRPRRG